jgi:hypothetical protein
MRLGEHPQQMFISGQLFFFRYHKGYSRDLQQISNLFSPIHFCDRLFCEKASLWPGGKSVARKKHRREKNKLRRFPSCFRMVRRAYRAPGLRRAQSSRRAPLHRTNPLLGEKRTCPPGPRNESRLMVFGRNALASRPGNAWNSTHLPSSWQELKGGKIWNFPLPSSLSAAPGKISAFQIWDDQYNEVIQKGTGGKRCNATPFL